MPWRLLWMSMITIIVVIADQLSKYFALKNLDYGNGIEVLPFLKLILVRNSGAAFGFLSNASGWQNLAFVVIAIVVCFVIIWMVRRMGVNETFVAVALLLILGGAIGNIIDRVTTGTGINFWESLSNGYVIDFIDFYYPSTSLSCFWPFYPTGSGCHFPTFNFADSAITTGAVMLLLDIVGLGLKKKLPGPIRKGE